MKLKNSIIGALVFGALTFGLAWARATVAVSPVYGSNMVIQRDQPFPVRGTAAPNKTITVTYNGQFTNTTSDAQGNWEVSLSAMSVKNVGSNFTISEAGGNTITLGNVLVGDVWLCSGQSNMGIDVNYCLENGHETGNSTQPDVATANFPGLRFFGSVPYAPVSTPTTTFNGGVQWSPCSPSTVGTFSAVAFYFGRTIYTNQNGNVPIGLIESQVGGTSIDLWLDPEGLIDIPGLAPLYSQSGSPTGAFSLFNGMIYPLAPYPLKGVIWYQGENAELTTQSADSYYLKQKGLIAGWKQLLGLKDCAFYLVQIANSGTAPASATPVLQSGGWNADTRLQQGFALNLPHAGVASAVDIGNSESWSGSEVWLAWHPTNKWDVGFRLGLWAMKNEYGQSNLVASGPVLRDVTVSGSNAICTFDDAGTGLMAGFKPAYGPAQPTNAPLALFSIAGANGVWYWATATVSGSNTLQLSSPSVPVPAKVAYACWQNPAGANFYNSNGLPALPFYVDDVTAKFTVTASVGTGGNISPAGVNTYLKRMTAVYTITPAAGHFIQDVKVDGTSVGALPSYTFDPLYANHTIAASFTNAQPTNTLTATAGGGGTLTPAGIIKVAQGDTQSFTVTPDPGLLFSLVVDGKPMGARSHFTLPDVRNDHTVAAVFYCTLNASAGFGGSISSPGVTSLPYGSNMTYSITPAANYSILKVTVDGTNVGPVATYTFTNVTTNHVIAASFSGGTPGGSVPQTNQLLFACLVDSLQTDSGGTITSWPTYLPARPALSPMGNPRPTVATLDGRPFAQNHYLNSPNGFNAGAYSAPISCSGATIVVVAKPIRNGVAGGWGCVVDAFYNQLSLGILNDTGKIFVMRNGVSSTSADSIPDGQTTILSLVVQPNGQYGVWANGVLIDTNSATSPLTSLVNGVAGGFANNISIGNNYPDSWSTYNGYIGDVFFYTNALSTADRLSLEQYLATRLMSANMVNYTITATAGAGGAISPSGAVVIAPGADQRFTITTNTGYILSDVLVDGVSQGAIASYTFTNVMTNATISAVFTYDGHTITATAGAGGTITPSGAVPVAAGANQSFTIDALPGGGLTNVLVDGVSQGPISAYTFTNVAADHTIEARFAYTNYTITVLAGPGGTINPAGSVIVGYDSNQSFTIAANIGYAISNVEVDGVSQGAVPGYTFTNVTANHTLSATFNVVPATGGIISVNYCQPSDILAVDDVAGVVPTNHWNSVIGEVSGGTSCSNPTNMFYDCTGEAVSGFNVTLSVNGFNSWSTGLNGSPNGALFSDWAMSGGGTITFTNIPYATYDLYIYLSSFNENGPVTYTISGGPNSGQSVSLQQNYNITRPQNFANLGLVQGTNWGKFTGLTGNRQTIVANDGLAAFQIVQQVAIAPTLSIAPNGTSGLEISWPDTVAGVLLTSPILGPGAVWSPVSGNPVHAGGRYKFTVTPSETNGFYGLSR